MSTVAEIEEALERLPLPEQQIVWQHLSQRFSKSSAQLLSVEKEGRKAWLADLRRMRRGNGTHKQGAPLQTVLDDLRGER